MGIGDYSEVILGEIARVFKYSDFSNSPQLIDDISNAQKIVLAGAGRVGYATRGFAMRLGHLGFNAYMLGDATVPSIGQGDLLIASSGSGETQTIYDVVKIAKDNKARIGLVTGNLDSRMGKLADTVILLRAPSKTKPLEDFISVQPMTTLNEQALGIFYDSLVLELMGRTGETHDSMWYRHSNLE